MQKPERPPFDSWDYYLAKAVVWSGDSISPPDVRVPTKTRTFCSMYWIKRLASSEVIRMIRYWSTATSTHADADVDSIHGAEERGLAEANTIVARTVNSLGAPASRG